MRIFLGAGALLAIAFLLPNGVQARPAEHRIIQVGIDHFDQFTLTGEGGQSIRFAVSHPRRRSPLVLYIQGSGCAPAFFETQPRQYASSIFSLTTTAHIGEYAVMAVDKPYSPPKPPPKAGLATSCPQEFNDNFSYSGWLSEVREAFSKALTLPWVDPHRTLVIGESEGATIAAGLAGADSRVTDVALVGGSGTTQLYDMILQAYASSGDDAEKLKALKELDETLDEINSSPTSTSKFAWGHTYLRWSSFFAASSARSLLHSKARVYLVSGMQDSNVPVLSTEVLYAELRAAGRDVTFRRIPGAGHDLLPLGADFAANMPRLENEFARITQWFYADVRR